MTNYLTNNDFSSGLDNWNPESGGNPPNTINNQSIGGQTLNAVNLPVDSQISQTTTVTLLANTTYYFSFYVEVDNTNNPNDRLFCSIYGTNPIVTTFSNLTNLTNEGNNAVYFNGTNTTSYILVSGNFTLSQDSTVTIQFTGLGGGAGVYNIGNIFLGIQSTPEPPCFNKGTNILCLNSNNEEVYIPVEQLKSGDLVKTYANGYKKIDTISHTTLKNNVNVFTQCMYVMPKQNDMTDDLIVTGGHSILVDNYESEQVKNHHKRLFGGLDLIDNKYLLLAGQTSLFKQITDDQVYDIYHLCLEGENENEDRRYGIWANGVLTESTYKSIIYNRIFHLDYQNKSTAVNKTKNAMLQMIKHKRYQINITNRKTNNF